MLTEKAFLFIMEKMKKQHIILGIDPGTRITGYGIIKTDFYTLTPLDYGHISPPATLPLYERYLIIHEGIEHLLNTFLVDTLSIESQFFSKNAQSALKLGMAKGMAILAAAKRKIAIYEYTPKKAKLAVVGRGNASKHQVQHMIQSVLQLKNLPKPEDVADALALAICHANHLKIVQTQAK